MSDNGKVVIIGLDGATFRLLRPLVEAGVMPTLKRFMSEGAWGNLLSTRPPVTCPAWPSMYTGVGPGKHGVFSFSHRDVVTGRVRTAASTDVLVPKLWDIVGNAGRRSAVLNVPITFPAQPLNGVTLTGFVSPDDSPHVTHPASLADELREELGELNLNWAVLGFRPADIGKREEHVRKINELMAGRVAQFEHILDTNPCDLCYLVHEYPDRVYHLYHHILDPAYPAHADPANASTLEMLQEGHRTIDSSIERMMDRFGPEANYLIVSDHGFGGVSKWVYLNNLLETMGLVKFRTGKVWTELIARHLHLSLEMREQLGVEPRELWHRKDPSLAPLIDYRRSEAFAGPQLEHAVYVNLKGRFAGGVVEPREYGRVRGRIIDALSAAKDSETGLPVFQGVWPREELYPGPHVDDAPDVIYELSPGYMVSNSIVPKTFLKGGFLRPLKSGWDISGYHRPEGVFLGWGPAFACVNGFEASILDITPTVLYLMNLPIPDYMDGSVMRAAIKPALLKSRARRVSHVEPDTLETEPTPYSEAEQVELTKRLEELGYL